MKTTAKGIAAAFAAAAIAALGTTAPALADAARPAAQPVVRIHGVGSAEAIDAAVSASGIGRGDVEAVEWDVDEAGAGYVVRVASATGEVVVHVDAATGAARVAA